MADLLTAEFWTKYGPLLLDGTIDTLVMIGISTVFAYLLGLPLGVALILTQPHGIRPNNIIYKVLKSNRVSVFIIVHRPLRTIQIVNSIDSICAILFSTLKKSISIFSNKFFAHLFDDGCLSNTAFPNKPNIVAKWINFNNILFSVSHFYNYLSIISVYI